MCQRRTAGTGGGAAVYNRQVIHADIDERAAVEAATRGDAAAFGVLVERHQQAAFRAAWLLLRDPQAAEDVAQEAFVRAYRQLSTFRRDASFRPWLLRIAHNLALNELRSRERRRGLFTRAAAVTDRSTPPPHDDVAARDEAADVLRAIDELPPGDRVVLHLRYFLDLPEREIAEAIARPAGTVKSRLHRASKRLRTVIEAKYPHLKESVHG